MGGVAYSRGGAYISAARRGGYSRGWGRAGEDLRYLSGLPGSGGKIPSAVFFYSTYSYSTEVPFINEVPGIYMSLFLDTDKKLT